MKQNLKERVKRLPLIGPLFRRLRRLVPRSAAAETAFTDSAAYWEDRYQSGASSGDGSYGRLASFKSRILNSFVHEHDVRTVIEFGCGDGNQLRLAEYPSYVGFDVSRTSVDGCRRMFGDDSSKRFEHTSDYEGEQADLALSLDVIYHLIENPVFESYMRTLFGAATRFVVVYSSNHEEDDPRYPHVRHRCFTEWVEQNATEWRLLSHIPNEHPFDPSSGSGSKADFFIYERGESDAGSEALETGDRKEVVNEQP